MTPILAAAFFYLTNPDRPGGDYRASRLSEEECPSARHRRSGARTGRRRREPRRPSGSSGTDSAEMPSATEFLPYLAH